MKASEMQSLFAYQAWANARVLETARSLTPEQFLQDASPFDSIRTTLVHMLDTERFGRLRWSGASAFASLQPDDYPDLATLIRAWQDESALLEQFLATLTDDQLETRFDFGARGNLPMWEMMFHAINHSTQHRSEIAVQLTARGHSPGDLDYFLFTVERFRVNQ